VDQDIRGKQIKQKQPLECLRNGAGQPQVLLGLLTTNVKKRHEKGGHPNPNLSDKIKPLRLSAEEKTDLVEYMKACTSPTPPVETGRLPAAD
jgi:hypothetical protein